MLKKPGFDLKVIFSMSWARIFRIPWRPAGRALPLAALAAILFPFCLYGQTTQKESPRQLFEEARQAQNQGNAKLAVREYRQLLKAHPEIVAARANLAAALVSLGRMDEAIAAYQAALKQVPGNPALEFNLALVYYKKGEFGDAASLFSALHKANPGDVRIATLLGNCDVQMGKNEEAIALLQPLEKANAGNPGLEWALGSAMIASGQKREGLKRVQKVADQGKNVGAYLLAAETALKLTYFDQARRNAEAAVRLNPHLSAAYVVIGRVNYYSSNQKGAEAAFKKAIQADPKNFQAHLELGLVFYGEHNMDAARQQFSQAIEINPRSAAARYELARVERVQGNLNEAVKQLELAEKEDPDWLPPHIDLAALYYRLKRPEDGAHQKEIVKQLMAAQQREKTKSRIIVP